MNSNIPKSSSQIQIFRPTLKMMTHFLTNMSQIQRICTKFNLECYDHKSQINYTKYCIKLMNVLEKSKILSQDNAQFKQLNIQQKVERICLLKNIKDQKIKFNIFYALRDINYHQNCVKFLQEQSFKNVLQIQEEAEHYLRAIWNNFNPGEQILDDIINQKWIDIGFQGCNPITDFRGSGVLGLHNLYHLSCGDLGKKLFKVAKTPDYQYFFASVSIYITVLALDCLRAKIYFLRGGSQHKQTKQSFLSRFQQIYQNLFLQFDRFWKKCKDRSLMQTNNNLKIFRKIIIENIPIGCFS